MANFKIGDTGHVELVSDTPRTDAAAYEESFPGVVGRDFAQGLERECAHLAATACATPAFSERGHTYCVRIAELECQNAELLEACRAAVCWADHFSPVDSCGSEETGSWLSQSGYAAIDGLRAAIAKAGGK